MTTLEIDLASVPVTPGPPPLRRSVVQVHRAQHIRVSRDFVTTVRIAGMEARWFRAYGLADALIKARVYINRELS